MIVFADSSAGTHTATNQDSVLAELLHGPELGRLVFAVVADGMGGMDHGELASATVVEQFANWLRRTDLRAALAGGEPSQLWREWAAVVDQTHRALLDYSNERRLRLGSTVTALLLTTGRYHVMNVGDTRCYEVTDDIRLLTEDHSLVAQEVRRGLLNEAVARTDSRQHVLLQCLGAGSSVKPDFYAGPAPPGAKYLVCTDGMRHFVSDREIWQVLAQGCASANQIGQLIEMNRLRGETDDISAVLVENSPQGGTNPLEPAAPWKGAMT
ncbi:MAG: protein phosphatase 2C domain-containing protein [Bifidobacteriaceae bacterium]|jgi:serine/threonine protein phosphatase PrpC|nr:protein phosphatase 2C domain-containing protein [Bifidobacteriaceae bacterium]